MEQLYETEYTVAPSDCGADGRLSYPGVFSLFQDLATAHADRLKLGYEELKPRSLFWLTVRTKIRFLSRPKMGERVTLRTWPETPGAVRCNRSYEIRRGEELLVCGKTDWAILNTATGGITPLAGLFPALRFDLPCACPGGYARVPDRFEGDPFAEYRVRSTDIDVGGHMNNAAYPRALFGAFSNAELAGRELREVDLAFRAPCFEGQLLQFYRKENGDALDLRIARGEETVLLARFLWA